MKTDIEKIASLSGLSLSDAERLAFAADIEEMLTFADKIKNSDSPELLSLLITHQKKHKIQR